MEDARRGSDCEIVPRLGRAAPDEECGRSAPRYGIGDEERGGSRRRLAPDPEGRTPVLLDKEGRGRSSAEEAEEDLRVDAAGKERVR